MHGHAELRRRPTMVDVRMTEHDAGEPTELIGCLADPLRHRLGASIEREDTTPVLLGDEVDVHAPPQVAGMPQTPSAILSVVGASGLLAILVSSRSRWALEPEPIRPLGAGPVAWEG